MIMDEYTIRTPENSPDHSTVGHHFGGYSIKHKVTAVYFCDSYDPRCGYWLTNIEDPEDRINVSERAIGRTFHMAEENPDYWWIRVWNVRHPKKKS